MSNAMRTGKRALAGVAAGALALGMLTIASAPAASAKPSIKPKATATATVSAVRATGGTLSIPAAKMGWRGTGLLATGVVDLTTAPTGGATMTVFEPDGVTVDDTVTLTQNGTPISGAHVSGDDTEIRFKVDVAGLYAGILANGTDTVSFSFTTAGSPASIALTPTTQTVLVGGVATVNVSLLDASGKVTQPQTVDSVTMSSSGDDTIAFTSLTGDDTTGKLQFGTFDDTIQTQSAGTSTITATPLGTLPASGVAAATATVVKSGTVSSTKVANMAVTTPADALNAVATGPWSATVPAGTTTVTVTVDDTTIAAAGNQLRFAASLSGLSGGTAFLNGGVYTEPVISNVTTDAAKKATLTYTLGGQALVAPAVLTVQQVNVANTAVSNSSITVTQTTPGALVETVPTGPVVAKLGASTPIAVTAEDSFGTPLSGWAVELVRTAPTTATVSATTTDSKGLASVTATPLSTTVNNGSETYLVRVRPVTGGTWTNSANLTITYTTSGNINTLTVGQVPGTPSSFSNTAATITTAPQVRVATGGDTLTGLVGATATTSTFTVATGAEAVPGNGASYATFTPDTNPGNPITVTVPTGVKVSGTQPTSTTLYSGGTQSVIIADNTPVYVWATKTGIHDITFASGGVTVTGKIKAINTVKDAYNVTVDKDEQTLNGGGIGRTDVTVSDMFGNVVASGSTTVAGGTATGDVLFGGFSNTVDVKTGTTGSSSIVVIAGPTGSGTVTFVLDAQSAAKGTTYTAPAGIAAPKLTAVQLIKIGAGPATKSITITGSRTTVSGKPGIMIDGVVTGIEDGKTVIPYFRFPGETTFAEGSARPVITDGSFTWQRKTGKKFYAYVTSDDGATTSNRVIIPAN